MAPKDRHDEGKLMIFRRLEGDTVHDKDKRNIDNFHAFEYLWFLLSLFSIQHLGQL